MASTVFQLSLRVVVFTLMFAIATLPMCTDQISCDTNTVCQPGKEKLISQTTVTPRPYNESKKAAYPVHRVEVSNGTAIKRLNAEIETLASESSSMAPHCSVKEAAAVDLGTLLDARDDAMVILVTGKTRLLAHRAVLAARSPIFATMLCHATQDASSGQVTVPDVEGPVLRQLLAYLYTLQAPQLPGMAPQLLAAADKFGLPVLREACEVQVAKQMTVETAAAAAVLAVRHSCARLRRAAIAYIRANLDLVMSTKRWADAERCEPEDLNEVRRLLGLPSPLNNTRNTSVCSTPVTTESLPTTAAPSLPQISQGWTPVTAAPVSQPTTNAPSLPDNSHGQTHVTAASPSPSSSEPDSDAVCVLRSLSSEEKGRRLIEAAKGGKLENVEVLLAAGVDVGARDVNRRTALYYASARGHVEVARRLLQAGAEVDARDTWQQTPLHFAAERGRAAVVRLLLAAFADPNTRDKGGWTPLHWAAIHGQAEAAAALLQAGADRGARTNRGRTPLDLARERKQQPLIQLLT